MTIDIAWYEWAALGIIYFAGLVQLWKWTTVGAESTANRIIKWVEKE